MQKTKTNNAADKIQLVSITHEFKLLRGNMMIKKGTDMQKTKINMEQRVEYY